MAQYSLTAVILGAVKRYMQKSQPVLISGLSHALVHGLHNALTNGVVHATAAPLTHALSTSLTTSLTHFYYCTYCYYYHDYCRCAPPRHQVYPQPDHVLPPSR